jgi:glycosyltransferase involved in cell wall biosynthesis
LKILHISHSDINGGAFRAAYRIHHALRGSGMDSTMLVNVAAAGDWTVESPSGKVNKAIALVGPYVGNLLRKTLRTQNLVLHSPAILPSNWVNRINRSDADIIHLHWVNGEMLSIADIGRIRKPIVWTLHDMWAFCGAEHYTDDHRWQEGYYKHNRPIDEGGFDLNRWTWDRKRKNWSKPLQIVTPSQWLADCVSKSRLMASWPVTVIPYAIDTNIWQPVERNLARQLLNLPQDVPLLLFGAIGGGRDPRKGFDLLCAALTHLQGEIPGLELVVFGQLQPKQPIDLGFPVHYTGRLHDDISLRILYSAADAMVVPSRQDNLPNTGLEAHACGTPVIAFNIGGMPDIVDNLKTGYLANPFDTHELAKGIQWVLADSGRLVELGRAARQKSLSLWSPNTVFDLYYRLYKSVLNIT